MCCILPSFVPHALYLNEYNNITSAIIYTNNIIIGYFKIDYRFIFETDVIALFNSDIVLFSKITDTIELIR